MSTLAQLFRIGVVIVAAVGSPLFLGVAVLFALGGDWLEAIFPALTGVVCGAMAWRAFRRYRAVRDHQ